MRGPCNASANKKCPLQAKVREQTPHTHSWGSKTRGKMCVTCPSELGEQKLVTMLCVLHTHTHIHTQIHTNTHTHMHAQTHTRTHTHVRMHAHTHTRAHTQTHTHSQGILEYSYLSTYNLRLGVGYVLKQGGGYVPLVKHVPFKYPPT